MPVQKEIHTWPDLLQTESSNAWLLVGGNTIVSTQLQLSYTAHHVIAAANVNVNLGLKGEHQAMDFKVFHRHYDVLYRLNHLGTYPLIAQESTGFASGLSCTESRTRRGVPNNPQRSEAHDIIHIGTQIFLAGPHNCCSKSVNTTPCSG